jgi:hypothetical protein
MVFENLSSQQKGDPHMSTHSYSRLWTHLIWETLNCEPMLDKRAAAKASSFLTDYSLQKVIYMKINYIANQEEHHRKRTYSEEYAMFVKRYGLEWRHCSSVSIAASLH